MSRAKPASTRSGHSSTIPVITRSQTVVLALDAPTTLGDVGKGLWTELLDLAGGLFQATDQWTIERWCSLQERRYQLLAVVDAEGLMTVGSTGQPVVHPALRLIDAIEGRLPGLEAVLALTPESRARLGLQAIETQSKLDAFLTKGGTAA